MTKQEGAEKVTYRLASEDPRLLATLQRVAAGGVGPRAIVRELIHLRSEHAKHFLNDDGTITAVIHSKPLHYREGDAGPWLDVDTSWQPSSVSGFAWEMTRAGYKAWIASSLGARPFLRVEHKGTTREFVLGRPYRRCLETGEEVQGTTLPANVSLPVPVGDTFTLDLKQGRGLRLIADTHRVGVELEASVSNATWRWYVPILPLGITAAETFYGETADGYIWGQNSSYATARSTSYDCSSADTTMQIGQVKSGIFYVHRGFVSFPTGTIDDDAGIASADLYLKAAGDNSTQDFYLRVYRYNWAEALCSSRESNYDGAYGGSATLEGTLRNTADGWSTGTYYSCSVDTSRINKTGDTKYSLVSNRDVAGTEPSTSEYVLAYTADQTGTGSDPYLVITYTAPVTIEAPPAQVKPIAIAPAISCGARVLAVAALVLLTALPAAIRGAGRAAPPPAPLAAAAPAPAAFIEVVGTTTVAPSASVLGLAPAPAVQGAAKAGPPAASVHLGALSPTVTGGALAEAPLGRAAVQARTPAVKTGVATPATAAAVHTCTGQPAAFGAARAASPPARAQAFVPAPEVCIGPVIEPPAAWAAVRLAAPEARAAVSLGAVPARVLAGALSPAVAVGARAQAPPALARSCAPTAAIATGAGVPAPSARLSVLGRPPALGTGCRVNAVPAQGRGFAPPPSVRTAARLVCPPATTRGSAWAPAVEMVESGIISPPARIALCAPGPGVLIWECMDLSIQDVAATALALSDAPLSVAAISDGAVTAAAASDGLAC